MKQGKSSILVGWATLRQDVDRKAILNKILSSDWSKIDIGESSPIQCSGQCSHVIQRSFLLQNKNGNVLSC